MAYPARDRDALGELLATHKPDDLSWEDVARLTGTAKTTIEQWLSGRTREPPLRPVLRIARLFEIPAEDVARAALGEARVTPRGSRGSERAAREAYAELDEALAALQSAAERVRRAGSAES